MRIVTNTGADRVIDLMLPEMKPGHRLDAVTSALSLFAYAAAMSESNQLEKARLLLPRDDIDLERLGSEADRTARNQLQTRWLAKRFAEWLRAKA